MRRDITPIQVSINAYRKTYATEQCYTANARMEEYRLEGLQ